MVVLELGSRFFTLVTLGFLPTVNGQPHRGISPPKPALWSRSRLGKNHELVCHFVFVNPSVAFAASPPQLQLMLVFFLSPSVLFINTSSVRSPIGLSASVPFCPTCFLSSPELLQVFQQSFLQGLLQIIKQTSEWELDYLSWLHTSSNSSQLCHSLLHVVVGGVCLNV